jgi:16S rRNA (cytidine1402-2'-O)-methyltransferase
MPGTLFVVATPIGNLEDITLRALRVLHEVAIIAAEDTRRTARLLSRHAIATPTTSLHEHNEDRKSRLLLARLEEGDNVALVSDAGTPAVSDPGALLIRSAIAAGIRIEPIPGPSAILTALVASGLPSDQFTFLGFPPTKKGQRKRWFDRLGQAGGTVIFFESPHRILSTLAELQEAVGDRTIAVARELTKVHEELVIGPISTAAQRLKSHRGEFTVVVDLGQIIEINSPEAPAELKSRRQALASLAQMHGLTANQLYEAIEHAKKSVKQPT